MTPLDTLRDAIAAIVREEVAKLAPKGAPADDYLTVGAAAELASVAPGTVRRWVREGQLTEHRAGRTLRVKRRDLERLLAAPASTRRAREETPEQMARRKFG